MRQWFARFWWIPAGGAVFALLTAIVVVAIAPHEREVPPPRARQYTDHTACMLTDQQGLAGPEAAAVWAGMQRASVATLTKISYLAATGPATTANARTYAAALTQQHCQLVIGVGPSQAEALSAESANHTDLAFAAVIQNPQPGLISISPGTRDSVSAAAEEIVTNSAHNTLPPVARAAVPPLPPQKPAW
jgi:hypothetical protein